MKNLLTEVQDDLSKFEDELDKMNITGDINDFFANVRGNIISTMTSIKQSENFADISTKATEFKTYIQGEINRFKQNHQQIVDEITAFEQKVKDNITDTINKIEKRMQDEF
jgi:hypothetical protein